ncbi:chromosome partitioning protein [Micromonospora sp. NPDC003776]
MVIEAGVVVGYLVAWAVRKARRAASKLDAEVDAAMDAGLDKLHEVVAGKLRGHPALEDLDEEAAAEDGEVSELTRQQVELAVTAAARKDHVFGEAVTELVTRLRAVEQAAGVQVIAGAQSTVFTGDAHVHARDSGVAIGQASHVTLDKGLGGQRQDPS